VRDVHCAHNVRDYVLDVADATRNHPGIVLGASPRASLGLLRAAQAHATVMGRDFVSPDDVKSVAPAALAHRITMAHGVDVRAGWLVVGEIVGAVASPLP
jgi:MoxR-like ATPase